MSVLNLWYPSGLQLIGTAGLDLETATLKLLIVDDSYVYNAAHDNISDLAAVDLGPAATVAGTRTMVGGTLVTDTATTTFTAPAAGDAGAVVLYENAGGTLLHAWFRNGDTSEIVGTLDGVLNPTWTFTLAATGGGFEIVRI